MFGSLIYTTLGFLILVPYTCADVLESLRMVGPKKVLGQLRSNVTLTCSAFFENGTMVTENTPGLLLKWEKDDRAIYVYSPDLAGGFDTHLNNIPDDIKERYSRNQLDLVISNFKETDMIQWIYCIIVLKCCFGQLTTTLYWIDFPDAAFQCVEKLSQSTLQNNSIIQRTGQSTELLVDCTYKKIKPPAHLVLYDSTQKDRLQFLDKDEASVDNEHYYMTINIIRNVTASTTFIVAAEGEYYTKTFHLVVELHDDTPASIEKQPAASTEKQPAASIEKQPAASTEKQPATSSSSRNVGPGLSPSGRAGTEKPDDVAIAVGAGSAADVGLVVPRSTTEGEGADNSDVAREAANVGLDQPSTSAAIAVGALTAVIVIITVIAVEA